MSSLRSFNLRTPVLVLSSSVNVKDKVTALELGADDYVPKPFQEHELVARIHALVRRSKGHAQSMVQIGDFLLNLTTKSIKLRGTRVPLTEKEYQILELLTLRNGTLVRIETLLSYLYQDTDGLDVNSLNVFIYKLRKKLASLSSRKSYIETIWGRGYALYVDGLRL